MGSHSKYQWGATQW